MNIHNLPQDEKKFRDGANAPKRVIYVTQDDGTYTQSQSVGWEPENIALEQAWEDIDMHLEEAKQLVLKKIKSPIYYFMYKNRMDIHILSAYIGQWKWFVKRHFKYSVFQKLSERKLAKYAQIFNIEIDELKNPF
ncbi:MAG TPA: hypothetical protein PKA54_05435 [Chitinophagaceae bacterium]|nr:hypothetical protein [Chitinophagaceae bacterium]